MSVQSIGGNSGIIAGGLLATALVLSACSNSEESPKIQVERAAQPSRVEQAAAQVTLATEQAVQATAEVAAQVAEEVTEVVNEATGGPEVREQIGEQAAVALEDAIKAVASSAEDAQAKVQAALTAMEPRLEELRAEVDGLGDLARRSTQDALRRMEAQLKDMKERAPQWQEQSQEYWQHAQTQLHTTMRRLEHDISAIKLDAGIIPVTDKPLGVPDRARPATGDSATSGSPPVQTRPRRSS